MSGGGNGTSINDLTNQVHPLANTSPQSSTYNSQVADLNANKQKASSWNILMGGAGSLDGQQATTSSTELLGS